MSKKTWIKVKRGLVLDPKHRIKMGIKIWLYQYMLDKCNWESGKVEEWIDRYAAEEMEMPLPTLRKQRVQLEEDGYISCLQNKHSQTITIHNWTNPREYSGKVYNEKNEGNQTLSPLKKAKGNHKGNHKGIGGVGTPTSNSHNTNHIKKKKEVVVINPSIKRALDEAGITGKKIQLQLSELDHVTPEYINAHAAEAEKKNIDLALLIHKIRENDPMPKHVNNIDKYTGGEFAEFINN